METTVVAESWQAAAGPCLAYSLVGRRGAPVVAVLGGISADRHVVVRPDGAPGWWASLFGAGRAVDTGHFRVLSFDFLGGNGDSSGPRSGWPAGGEAPEEVSTFDQARALAALLDRLGIETLHSFVGASYGGMVALAFAELFPERLSRLVVVSAAHAPAPMATAWRTIQRRILALAAAGGRPEEGLALARALAMTTYRTQEEFSARFGGAPGAVWDYLEARGHAYVERMHPAAFLTLSRSIDLHAVHPERLVTPLTLVGVPEDQCVPLALIEELAGRVAGPVELHHLPSLFGHDAFLKEDARLAAILRPIHGGSAL